MQFSALNVNDVSLEQPEKAEPGILETFSPIVNEVRLEQPEKEESQIDVTELPMVTEVSPEQL